MKTPTIDELDRMVGPVKEVLLTKVRSTFEKSININHPVDYEVEVFVDYMTNSLRARLEVAYWGSEWVETGSVRVPSTWWDHLKMSFVKGLPIWLMRWGVKWIKSPKMRTIITTKQRTIVVPHLSIHSPREEILMYLQNANEQRDLP